MSVGSSIVATAVGGVPGVLTDGVDALLVPPGRPDLLADAIMRLGDNPSLRQRLGVSARARGAIFDVTVACRRVEDIYREHARA